MLEVSLTSQERVEERTSNRLRPDQGVGRSIGRSVLPWEKIGGRMLDDGQRGLLIQILASRGSNRIDYCFLQYEKLLRFMTNSLFLFTGKKRKCIFQIFRTVCSTFDKYCCTQCLTVLQLQENYLKGIALLHFCTTV